MAARRLIIVLVMLFAISIVAASIAPDRRGGLIGDDSTSTSSSTTTTTTSAPPPSGDALTVRIDASASKPETVETFVGDQLELNVGSERAREIEIADFGVTEDAAPYAPANFNLLLREAGRLAITDADTGQILGLLVITEPEREQGR
jgi:hypothetical protein